MSRSAALAVLLLLAPSTPVLAGGPLGASPFVTLTTGGIRGRVMDAAGAPIAGASILAIAADGRVWFTQTGVDSAFRAGLLPPGTYVLRVDGAGHAPLRSRDLVVKAGTWLIPGTHGFGDLFCGNGPRPLRLQSQRFDCYEFSFAGTSNWTQEEISRLPLR